MHTSKNYTYTGGEEIMIRDITKDELELLRVHASLAMNAMIMKDILVIILTIASCFEMAYLAASYYSPSFTVLQFPLYTWMAVIIWLLIMISLVLLHAGMYYFAESYKAKNTLRKLLIKQKKLRNRYGRQIST